MKNILKVTLLSLTLSISVFGAYLTTVAGQLNTYGYLDGNKTTAQFSDPETTAQ